jgi:glycosyltransferase involved in cell wall biosynthesis
VGDIIVLMDGDLQNDPADIPNLLAEINNGYDLVSGWRIRRKDNFFTRTVPSRIANWIISRVTGVYLHDYGCTLKAYRREVLTGFRLYGEMHRFIPAYAGYVGARVKEVPVQHHPRRFGKTSYGLERTVKVVLDLFTVKFLSGYVHKPIYLFGGIGIAFVGVGAIGLLYLFIRKFLLLTGVVDSPVFLLSALLFVLGVQSILLGLIAEMTVRTYHESQSKPIYNVRFVIRGEDAE